MESLFVREWWTKNPLLKMINLYILVTWSKIIIIIFKPVILGNFCGSCFLLCRLLNNLEIEPTNRLTRNTSKIL